MTFAANQNTPSDDELMLEALNMASVDNWDWYDESLAELSEAERTDATEVVEALRSGGVDDWDGWEYVLEHYHRLRREHGLNTDEDEVTEPVAQEPAVEQVDETPEEDMLASERRLRNILGDEKYESEGKAIWKANYSPKVYNKALKTLVKGATLEDVRNNYLDLLYGVGAGR
jgi:hypothetical protein